MTIDEHTHTGHKYSLQFKHNKPIHCLANIRLETINWSPTDHSHVSSYMYIPSMLKCIGLALFLQLLRCVLLEASTGTEILSTLYTTNKESNWTALYFLACENVNSQDKMVLFWLLYFFYVFVSYIKMLIFF